MRSSLRTALGAVLTTAVVLSVPVSALATPAEAPATAEAPSPAPAPETAPLELVGEQAKAALDRLGKALQQKVAPRKLGDPMPRKDVSLLMRDAKAVKAEGLQLTARQQSIYDQNGRPVPDSSGCSDYSPLLQAKWVALESPSGRFCVHYRPSLSVGGGGATDTDAQRTAIAMDEVYTKEVTQLGFRPPVADSDGMFDVFLDQLGDQGLYGFCGPDTGSRVSTAYCGLDNNFAEFGVPAASARAVTAAHEFFHAIQYAYDAGDSTWFMEGTAAWMEEQTYPNINDYLQYLNYSQLRNWRQSLDYVGDLHRYSSVIFFKFLSERYRDAGIVRQIWNKAAASAGGYTGIQAISLVLRARGSSLPDEFARYGVWNTLGAGTYGDRGRFPVYRVRGCNGVRWCAWGGGTLGRTARDTGSLGVALNHLSTAPLVLRAGKSLPSRTKLRVIVNAPDTARGARARVQVRLKSGRVTTYTVVLNRAGNGSRLVGFNPRYVSSAIVTLSNGSSYYNKQVFKVRARAAF